MSITQKLQDLLAPNLWHGTEQGLAFFRTRNGLHSFFVPLRVASRVIVGDRFFLKPLIPSLIRTRRMMLDGRIVRKFECAARTRVLTLIRVT